uniref:EF-hand domain-containing protein n=1 Tax=Craspedostauros australis TaxID=1486917 RepID=A0A7R9WTH3_9STRA
MVSDKVTESDQYDDHDLSSQEMDALSQLLTPDPVSKEKADLERLKSAIQDDKQDKISSDAEAIEEVADDTTVPSATAERVDANEAELQQQQQQQQKSESDQIADSQFDDTAVAAAKITEADEAAKAEAEASTTFTTDAHLRDASNAGDTLAAGDAQVVPQAEDDVDTALVDDEVEEEEDVVVDPVVDRLRQRIESMVDKIEVQLSAVKIKIGDKLHFLDKDMDGILSREEMADCLQQVLKREITLEEAMEIAAEMDENKDGLFTVGELIQWIETNKLVQFVKEGRDAEMEEIIVSHEKDKDDDNNKMDVLEDTTAKSSSKSK